MEAYKKNEKNRIFNLILALYAGEDEEAIFVELAKIYEKYPREVEFYIPQLCTYLFHFDSPAQSEKSRATLSSQPCNSGLKKFLMEKSKENIIFGHLMFWCILSSQDDT